MSNTMPETRPETYQSPDIDGFTMGSLAVSAVATLGAYIAEAIDEGSPTEIVLAGVSGVAFLAACVHIYKRGRNS